MIRSLVRSAIIITRLPTQLPLFHHQHPPLYFKASFLFAKVSKKEQMQKDKKKEK